MEGVTQTLFTNRRFTGNGKNFWPGVVLESTLRPQTPPTQSVRLFVCPCAPRTKPPATKTAAMSEELLYHKTTKAF